jgi:hypothetical protein
MDIWNKEEQLEVIVPKKGRKFDYAELGNNRVPDIDKTNNYISW